MKKIILLSKISLTPSLKKSLEKEGLTVFSPCEFNFVYKTTFFARLLNIFHRIFRNDKNFPIRDYKKKYLKELLKKIISNQDKFDYTLILRADLFSEKIIKLCRKKSFKQITYQCDGNTYDKVEKYKKYFDRIFFFDKVDLDNFEGKALPLTNCWFPDKNSTEENKYDFFYVGVGTPERIKFIQSFSNHISDKNFNSKIILAVNQFEKEREISKGIKTSYSGLSYDENLNHVKKSKAIIDLKLPYHNGLSFRFFEALYYKKKIITNNHTVKHYDFYHPDNIFITDFQNFDGLEEFMQKPYFEIDQKIVDKYGFKNWIRYVLDTPPYQKIDIH